MITPSFGLTATERVLPKLALNFTTASLDSRVTFTRSGNTATVVNSSGFIAPINADLPRFDYDPVTLACKGLLIEEARTNLALYSEDFTNAFWTKGGTSSISATLITSPANTATANILVGADGTDRNGNVLLRTYTGLTSGASYTVSYYVIGQGGTTATLYARDATTGAFGGTTLALTGTWQRITRTITLGASTTACNTYLGNTNGDIGVWGGQFELGAFATSYIPTEASALTRNADVATMTGTNFSDWFNATEGTIFCQTYSDLGYPNLAFSFYADANNTIFNANDGTIGRSRLLIRNAGSFVTNVQSGTTTYQPMKQAFGLKSGANSGAVNGTLFINNNAATLPSGLSELWIGRRGDTGGATNAWVQKINYYPLLLTQSELRAISK